MTYICICSDFTYSNNQRQNYTYYTVKKGDSLSSVARNHSVSIDSIAKLNNISNQAQINIGARLKIPTSNSQTNNQNTNANRPNQQANNQNANTNRPNQQANNQNTNTNRQNQQTNANTNRPNPQANNQSKNNYIDYTVKKGDTLSSVARNHSVSVNSIAELNNISNQANINIGARLKIPRVPVYIDYTVKKGDTLSSIARSHSVSVDSIANLNNLSNQAKLNIGMKLKIQTQGESLPKFIWPSKNIVRFQNDGTSGVSSIGLIIFSKPGTEIISSGRGTVKKIGEMRGYGRYIVISHADRYMTVYSNLSNIRVKEGEEVNIGRVIATSNNETGRIHFQIDHAGRPADPLKYLPKRS